MYCAKCGNKVNPNDKFCIKCGNPQSQGNITKTTSARKKTNNITKVLAIIVPIVIVLIIVMAVSVYKSNNSRTIMIYMVGSDLESRIGLGSRDLKDLDFTKVRKNRINVLLMAGGSKRWDNTYVDSNETSIYKLTETGFEKVDQRQKTNMGQSDNLLYFLNYSYQNSKTRKYDLLFWNHGGAVDGSEYDELSIMGDHLNLIEFKEALEKSPFSKKKLEVVSFRTCLNGTLEVANVFKDYAEYLVASEEVTLGSKLDSALRFINEIKPQDSGLTYGKKQITTYKETITNICNFQMNSNQKENYCETITYSITDLSKIDRLNNELDSFSADLNKKLSSNYNDYSKLRANLKQYGADEPLYDMVDLKDFATKFKSYSNKSDGVINAFDKAVLYNFSNNDYSHGLSIYYPYNGNEFIDNYYDKITPSKEYESFVTNHYKLKTSRVSSSSFNSIKDNKIDAKTKSKYQADFEMELTDEQVENFAKAQYLVFVKRSKNEDYYNLVYGGYDTKIENNKLKASVVGKTLRFSDIKYDDISYWVLSHEKKVTKEYVDVEVGAILKRGIGNSDLVTITLRIYDDSDEVKIVSVVSNSKNKSENLSVLGPVEVDLNEYTTIDIASQSYKITNENGKFDMGFFERGDGTYRGLSMSINKFRFIKESFDSNYEYYAVFRIFDTSGKEYYSNLIRIGG